MNPQINLFHLKLFCDAVVYQSITESARLNYVTQSTVSQAITKLESVLGVKILTHSRQKFQITEEGKILFDKSRHVFKAIQEIHEGIHQNQETISGVLKFVCTNSLGMSFIAPNYKKMQIHIPQVQMDLKLGNLNFIL
jgi:LysR family transcriptional regulator, carnitine catabolism transcriptional activator